VDVCLLSAQPVCQRSLNVSDSPIRNAHCAGALPLKAIILRVALRYLSVRPSVCPVVARNWRTKYRDRFARKLNIGKGAAWQLQLAAPNKVCQKIRGRGQEFEVIAQYKVSVINKAVVCVAGSAPDIRRTMDSFSLGVHRRLGHGETNTTQQGR